MKRKDWIIAFIILAITGFEFVGLAILHRTTKNFRQEIVQLDNRIALLKQQKKIDCHSYQIKIQKLREQVQENAVIYGYITGYLAVTNPKLITDEISEFAALTINYAKEAGVSPYDCLTICQIENGFDLHKEGKAGEQGPAQLMDTTWGDYYKEFGYKPEDFYKWQCNYRVAIAYFAELLKRNNNEIKTAIGEYNGGGKWALSSSSRTHVRKFVIASRGVLELRKQKRSY